MGNIGTYYRSCPGQRYPYKKRKAEPIPFFKQSLFIFGLILYRFNIISDKFSKLKKGPSPEFTSIKEPEQLKIRESSKMMDKEQSLVIMGFKGSTIKSRDRYTLQLINVVLSGISGRLSTRLRKELGITYAVGAISI